MQASLKRGRGGSMEGGRSLKGSVGAMEGGRGGLKGGGGVRGWRSYMWLATLFRKIPFFHNIIIFIIFIALIKFNFITSI